MCSHAFGYVVHVQMSVTPTFSCLLRVGESIQKDHYLLCSYLMAAYALLHVPRVSFNLQLETLYNRLKYNAYIFSLGLTCVCRHNVTGATGLSNPL